MTEEIDIWRAAKLLVDRHGDEAPKGPVLAAKAIS